MNALGIDPKNLGYEFRNDWRGFQTSRIKQFLVAWLQKELASQARILENVSPDDLRKAQGSIATLRRMINMVERRHCEEPVKEVLAFLDKKE
jgi:hypothetical protein